MGGSAAGAYGGIGAGPLFSAASGLRGGRAAGADGGIGAGPLFSAAAGLNVLTITRKRSFLYIRPEGSVIIRAAGANHLSDY